MFFHALTFVRSLGSCLKIGGVFKYHLRDPASVNAINTHMRDLYYCIIYLAAKQVHNVNAAKTLRYQFSYSGFLNDYCRLLSSLALAFTGML